MASCWAGVQPEMSTKGVPLGFSESSLSSSSRLLEERD